MMTSIELNNFYIFHSDTSGPEENGSASDGEMDSDADSVFLPSRQHSTYRRESTDNISAARDHETPFMKSIPSTLNLGRCNITDYNVDVERQNAKQFVKTLQNVMVPKLLSFRTCVEVTRIICVPFFTVVKLKYLQMYKLIHAVFLV